MEVALEREPVPRVRLTSLAREPLLWAALAAFVGSAAGLHAKFVDRFVGGMLVEHEGEADLEELLRQRGHGKGGE